MNIFHLITSILPVDLLLKKQVDIIIYEHLLQQSQMRSIRLFHVCRTIAAVDKGSLAKLRKKTGFSMSNCKKALEINENDLAKVITINFEHQLNCTIYF